MPPEFQPVRNVVFDFDGTLADSFDAVCRIGARLAREAGRTPAPNLRREDFRGKSAREVVREFGIPLQQIPRWLRRMRAELKAEVPHLRPFKGMPETLHALSRQGVVLHILSSNSRGNIKAFLVNHGLAEWFAGVYSSPRLFGKSGALTRLMRQRGLRAAETVYAGDEVRDIEAARDANLRVAAVCWGFNSRALLERHGPDFLVDEPRQLEALVNPPPPGDRPVRSRP